LRGRPPGSMCEPGLLAAAADRQPLVALRGCDPPDALHAWWAQECEERGATIIYATHIFDGLEQWITHLAYVEGGKLVKGATTAACQPAAAGTRSSQPCPAAAATRCWAAATACRSRQGAADASTVCVPPRCWVQAGRARCCRS
jgi:hypothetical protein